VRECGTSLLARSRCFANYEPVRTIELPLALGLPRGDGSCHLDARNPDAPVQFVLLWLRTPDQQNQYLSKGFIFNDMVKSIFTLTYHGKQVR
jgi:hypothetical protein